jgi:6-phosphogluconolactonase
MKLRILPDAEAVAQKATQIIAELARERIRLTGKFLFAASGGSTPWKVLRQLADKSLPWEGIELFQVDERIAPAGDLQRNLTRIKENLLEHSPLIEKQIHAMPVEQTDLESAAETYAQQLHKLCGNPVKLDLIHLGLGEDGHTASLLPGDPARNSQRPITVTNEYQGLRRMTMTYPVINAAQHRLWIVTGSNKQPMLERLYHGDESIPAGLVERNNAIILADQSAAGTL